MNTLWSYIEQHLHLILLRQYDAIRCPHTSVVMYFKGLGQKIFLWRNIPHMAQAASLLRFLGHTQLYTHFR
jgi:hypothetical protein